MRRKIAIFDVLGVRTEDDITTIRAAWRKKVRELHPDIAEDKDASGALLARINAAFGDLKNHKPFADRRRKSHRQTGRRGRVWTPAEREAAKQRAAAKNAEMAEDLRRRAKLDRAARKRAEAKAAARAAAKAHRAQAQAKPVLPPKEKAAVRAALHGYTTARQAIRLRARAKR